MESRPPPPPATISSKRRRLRQRGGGGPTGSLDTPQCRRGPAAAPRSPGAQRPRRPSVARARAAVGLGLHPATLPRPRARCSRFSGGWRRFAEAVAEDEFPRGHLSFVLPTARKERRSVNSKDIFGFMD
eukprot:gene21773-biopygen11694